MAGNEITSKRVRIERIFPDNLKSYFVSDIVIQHQPDAFIISFSEVWAPIVLGESESEKQQVIDAIDQVEAKCVARVVMTPSKMREFYKALSENLKTYDNMIKLEKEFEQD